MNSQASRLLIVDDNELNRDMLARRLVRQGYEIVVADSARQLPQSVKEKRHRSCAVGHRNARN